MQHFFCTAISYQPFCYFRGLKSGFWTARAAEVRINRIFAAPQSHAHEKFVNSLNSLFTAKGCGASTVAHFARKVRGTILWAAFAAQPQTFFATYPWPSLCEQSELQCYRPNLRPPHFASKVSYNAAPPRNSSIRYHPRPNIRQTRVASSANCRFSASSDGKRCSSRTRWRKRRVSVSP